MNVVDDHDLMPDGRKLPYWVKEEVTATGADWNAEFDADESVTVDGDLVTARRPEPSHAGVMAFVEELGVTPPA